MSDTFYEWDGVLNFTSEIIIFCKINRWKYAFLMLHFMDLGDSVYWSDQMEPGNIVFAVTVMKDKVRFPENLSPQARHVRLSQDVSP